MALSDTMFLCELIIEGLTSFVKCNDFIIQSQFADVFIMNLKDPNELRYEKPKKLRKKKRVEEKSKYKASNLQTGQSVLFESDINILIETMKNYPMELSIRSKKNPDWIGSTHIPWSWYYIDYLNRILKEQDPPPVSVRGDYNIFDEYTSRCMAVINLNIKLCCLKDRITTGLRSLSQETPEIITSPDFRSESISPVSERIEEINLAEKAGTIKTVYGRRKLVTSKKTNKESNSPTKLEIPSKAAIVDNTEINEFIATFSETKEDMNQRCNSIVTLVQSDTEINHNKPISILKSKSCSSIHQEQLNILNYIFGDNIGPFGNQVYCVGYLTVQDPDSPNSIKSKQSVKSQSSAKSDNTKESDKDDRKPVDSKERFKFRICSSNMSCANQSVCSLDIPQDAENLIKVKRCDRLVCNQREFRPIPEPRDDRILLDLTNLKNDCCEVSQKVENVIGEMKAKMKVGDDPCFCECECKFGFVKRTTYCNICGGYENSGEDMARKRGFEMPYPCPIFHKLADKNKQKALGAIGSDIKNKTTTGSDTKNKTAVERSRGEKNRSDNKSDNRLEQKTAEFEKGTKKGKRIKNERFKFNYGYTGIPPHIGHSQCAMPCTGTLGSVPKNMGWLWTAGNVPGLKFRPSWRPGAANKRVVRMLKIAKNPDVALSKKRRRVATGKSKKPLKRPLLVVHKKDGEYTVTMETMKQFAKPRMPNQHPYEDKPLVTYTIGRTDEENFERRKKKERAQRRLERAQRQFIQSAFRDMCHEICVKTYQQALGILPNAEIPDCHCFPTQPTQSDCDLEHSCSCSEDKSLTDSDFTDSDEWIIEFTPPNAFFDPSYNKSKKITTTTNSTQYSFLDYKVKLLDRYGNPVPRFFKGPDGKRECSDLGGFWGPNKKWMEINVDGFIGPDEKWAPMVFIGPNGEQVDAETGKFQTAGGKWLVVGIDGYADQGKWKYYNKPKKVQEKRRYHAAGDQKKGELSEVKGLNKASETTWSCFGEATPKQLSKMGIVGHGHDKKLLISTLKDMLARGEDVKIPEPSTVPRIKHKKGKCWYGRDFESSQSYFADRVKCKHPTPPTKGIIAVNDHGDKAYFKTKVYKNKRPNERLTTLADQGISLSSFHIPCLDSFISCEMMKKQRYERLMRLAGRDHTDHHDEHGYAHIDSYKTTATDAQHYRNIIV